MLSKCPLSDLYVMGFFEWEGLLPSLPLYRLD